MLLRLRGYLGALYQEQRPSNGAFGKKPCHSRVVDYKRQHLYLAQGLVCTCLFVHMAIHLWHGYVLDARSHT